MRASNSGWAIVLAVLAGCGGATSTEGITGDGGAGDGGAGGGDGSVSDGGIIGCPATPPTAGSACAGALLACEYGTSPIVECNALYTCNGTWSTSTRGNDPQYCHPSTSGCPATRAAVPVGAACSPSGLECDYPTSRCACTISMGGPVRVDAGSEWLCDSPQADCPAPRPLVGSACTSPGKSCDYGACTLPGGVSLTCESGRWQDRPAPCPQ